MNAEPTVFVIDDDAGVRKAMAHLLRSMRLKYETHEDPAAFLEACTPEMSGCVISDVRMPSMSGLELQERMRQRGVYLPMIFITGFGEIAMASRAFRGGAIDFLEKPFSDEVLLERIREAIRRDTELRAERQRQKEIRARLELLTEREREILRHLLDGLTSKAIGFRLGICQNTVENHRASIMRKLQAEGIVHLVRMFLSDPGFPRITVSPEESAG